MDREALMSQLKALRGAAQSLVDQIDAIAMTQLEEAAPPPAPVGCQHPERSTVDVGTFQAPNRRLCKQCGEFFTTPMPVAVEG